MDLSWIESDIRRILRDGGSVIKTNVTINMLTELQAYIHDHSLKLKVSYLNGKLYVRGTSGEHGRASGFCTLQISSVNNGMSGANWFPIFSDSDANVNLTDRNFYQPDTQFQVDGRFDHSPNMVIEVNFRGDTINQLVRKGMDYMEHTNNVLSVILIGMHDYDTVPRTMSMVICEIRRILPPVPGAVGPAPVYAVTAANPNVGVMYEFRDMVSFGNVPPHAAQRTAWENATYNIVPFSGVGFVNLNAVPVAPYPACNAMNQPDYLYTVPARYLLALDNVGLQLVHVPNGPNIQNDYQLDLYGLQLSLLRVQH